MSDLLIVESAIVIPRDAAFSVGWPLVDADTGGTPDMTGWTGRSEVRDDFAGALITRFLTGGDPTYGGIVTFDAAGNVVLGLPYTRTKLLALTSTAVFDVVLTNPGGEPFRIVEGRAYVTPEVTSV